LDAPEERYFLFMQQTAFQSDNIVLLHENTLKLDAYLFTGFGGEITQSEKEDYFVLQYPRQEVLFGTRRMRFLNPPRILLFYTPPVSLKALRPLFFFAARLPCPGWRRLDIPWWSIPALCPTDILPWSIPSCVRLSFLHYK
jgi:hypothetical protein